jgi:predicted nucleic acid-binding protein
MKVLFDTDVTLDLLLDREPHSENAAILFSKSERGELSGYLCATTVTTIHYLVSKALGSKKARNSIRKLLSFLDVSAVDRTVVVSALETKNRDFEDGVIAESARLAETNAIITRNIKDFRGSTIPAFTPGEFLKILEAGS